MRKYIVCIASHLDLTARHHTIKYALQSVADNTVVPDQVIVSYSYVTPPDEDEWISILKGISCKFIRNETRKQQFDHYKLILEHVSDNDVLMFLDDDDLYCSDKISMVKHIFETTDAVIVRHEYETFETLSIHDPVSNLSQGGVEHWLYAMHASELKKYFETYPDIIKEFGSLTDLHFMAWLSHRKDVVVIEQVLMYNRSRSWRMFLKVQ